MAIGSACKSFFVVHVRHSFWFLEERPINYVRSKFDSSKIDFEYLCESCLWLAIKKLKTIRMSRLPFKIREAMSKIIDMYGIWRKADLIGISFCQRKWSDDMNWELGLWLDHIKRRRICRLNKRLAIVSGYWSRITFGETGVFVCMEWGSDSALIWCLFVNEALQI